MSTQHTSRARSPFNIWPGSEGPLKGPRSSRVLDALSCYLSLILKHSDTKLGRKKKIIVDHNLEGSRGACCNAPPPGSATDACNHLERDKTFLVPNKGFKLR